MFLFFLVIKAELRRPFKESKESDKRIKKLCSIEDSASLVADYPDKINDIANKIMVPILKHPTKITIGFARLIFGIQKALSF